MKKHISFCGDFQIISYSIIVTERTSFWKHIMSRHEGVSCDNCLMSNFRQKRFKCLICYDYDLCEICYDNNVSTSRHSPSHPMQCILTKHAFDLFYGGEGIGMDSPPSLTCPLCGKKGFTEVNLQEHVNSQHLETSVEVVCPICAAIPTGDPNHVTDDFATHLAIEHNTSHRTATIEDPIGGRQSMRRMFYPGRSTRGARAQRSANMHFTSGPSSVPGFGVANAAASTIPQMRDAMDPIAELLSQLSGVRRNAQQLQQTVSTASQLQELQAQLQLERQRASIIRQQLERIPGKIQTAQNGKQTSQPIGTQNKNYANAVKANKEESSVTVSEDDDPRLLLSKIYDKDSEAGSESQNIDIFEQSLFVRELILSLPIEDGNDAITYDSSLTSPISPVPARAIPVDCGVSAAETSQPATSRPAVKSENEKVSLSSQSGPSAPVESDRVVESTELFREEENGMTEKLATASDHDVSYNVRKSNSAEKSSLHHQSLESMSELKKESNVRQAQFSSDASSVAGLVRSQSSHPVSPFPVLVSGTSEQ
uniref:E3 ubiquitin-protein ligase KCMF1-like n=1 Tax=Styela clava TaxID=7725 RepID=UPI00193931ED|nr:E3 ubiquitin-protein ligase KCMF1-like [Styela clava]